MGLLNFFDKTVLLVTDDALYVYACVNKGVDLVETIPWEIEQFEDALSSVLMRDCKGRAVIVLNDMVEQHFRKEKVLKQGASIFDRRSMIERRLKTAFPTNTMRSFYKLNEKISASEKQREQDLYIFSSIPDTSNFLKVVSVLKNTPVAIKGLYLLPIESSDFVKALSGKLSNVKKSKSKWAVFIGQHRSGGIRQIVTKNGELALTRMTLSADMDQDPQSWATEVHKEFKSTMSYLARFGYNGRDGLDLMVVGEPDACDFLQTMIEDDSISYTSFTAGQCADLLKIKIGANKNQSYYADELHVAWLAKKKFFLSPVQSAPLSAIAKPRKMAGYGMIGLACLFLVWPVLGALDGQRVATLQKDYKTKSAVVNQLDVTYNKELAKKNDLGFDVELIQNTTLIYNALDKGSLEYKTLFGTVGQSLGQDVSLAQIYLSSVGAQDEYIDASLRRYKVLYRGQGDDPEAYYAPYEMKLVFEYPATADAGAKNSELLGIRNSIRENLPQASVDITKSLNDLGYLDEIVASSEDTSAGQNGEATIAEIMVRQNDD